LTDHRQGQAGGLLAPLDAAAARVPQGAATLFLQVARALRAPGEPRLIDEVVSATRALLLETAGNLGSFELRLPELSILGIWFASTEEPFRIRGGEGHRRWSAWARERGEEIGVFNVRLPVEHGRVAVPSETFEVLLATGLLL